MNVHYSLLTTYLCSSILLIRWNTKNLMKVNRKLLGGESLRNLGLRSNSSFSRFFGYRLQFREKRVRHFFYDSRLNQYYFWVLDFCC